MLAPTLLGRMLQREWLPASIALAVVIALCWRYLLTGAGTMRDMGGMTMPMSLWPWTIAHATTLFVMWLAMMTAMMLPGASPVILLYSRICQRGGAGPSVAPMLFASGYLAAWACFSLIAVLAQFLLEWAGLLSSMMEATSTAWSGALLVAAGLYQITPLKRACLQSCRSPLEFLTLHWQAGKAGALKMGMRHGSYCVGCCWALMLLLFVGGVMNLGWIAGIAIYVLAEKLFPGGRGIAWTGGAALIAAGVFLLGRPLI
jgi:predicted metal-binding membrane protein